MDERVLVFGASGKFGSLVVPALAARGIPVRAFAHGAADAHELRTQGGLEVVTGDLTKSNSVRQALDGIQRVFYLAPAFMPDEAEVGKNLVAACTAAGVKRFVFSSVIHPVISGLSNHAAKAPVEEAVLGSGMEYTFLHPALFFQNYATAWNKVVEDDVLAEPWACETRFSRVDYRDVADVAAIALVEERLLYGTFELCAEGWLNRYDVAALIGKALGREIKAEKTDAASLGDSARLMRPMFEHYDRVGLRGNALTLRAILGREPRSLHAFIDELVAATGA